MAVLKHPAIGAKSRFTKIYENLRKSCDVTKMRFGRKYFVSQKCESDARMGPFFVLASSFSSWRYSWAGFFRILDFGNLIKPYVLAAYPAQISRFPIFDNRNVRSKSLKCPSVFVKLRLQCTRMYRLENGSLNLSL